MPACTMAGEDLQPGMMWVLCDCGHMASAPVGAAVGALVQCRRCADPVRFAGEIPMSVARHALSKRPVTPKLPLVYKVPHDNPTGFAYVVEGGPPDIDERIQALIDSLPHPLPTFASKRVIENPESD